MVISAPAALASLPASPWKNGGGSTRTLAVEPEGAGLDNFLWRVSLADVSAAGPFSQFANVDRTILLWSGDGLFLRAQAWSHQLNQPLTPFSFRGEEEIDCRLVGGTTTDLNIMVRRGTSEVTVEVAKDEFKVTSRTSIVLCAEGQVQIECESTMVSLLSKGEFVRMDDCKESVRCIPAECSATFVVIGIER